MFVISRLVPMQPKPLIFRKNTMFEQLGNLTNLLKQAQEMKAKVAQIQEDLKSEVVEAEAGEGAIRVEATGDGQIVSVGISPQLFEQGAEAVENLLPEALNAALLEAEELRKDRMREVTGGLNLPGMGDMMDGLLP